MTTKIVLYTVVIGAPLIIQVMQADQGSQSHYRHETVLVAEYKALQNSHSHRDQLDIICEHLEQNNIRIKPRSNFAETARAVALRAVEYYYRGKEFVTNSWHSLKEKITRR